ncbi:MAG TPA: porin [Rhizomicrobium sp.]|nr:porin [Rhizomicrobium sp.]
MQGKSALMTAVAVVALTAAMGGAYAQGKQNSNGTSSSSTATDSGPSNAELAARIQALEDELQAYEGKRQADHTRLSTLEQNFGDTQWSFDNARPTVKSGDGRFTMAFRVRFQVDDANFMQDSSKQLQINSPAAVRDLSSGAVVRRGFFGVEGKAFNDFWYEFRLNGGGSNGGGTNNGEGDPLISLARVAYTGIDHFELNVGVIEPAFMYEGVMSSGQLPFIERPEIDNIAADAFGAGDARRGVEVRFQKEDALMPGDNLVLNLAYTGAKTGSTTGHGPGGDEQTQLLGRASYRFWHDGVSNASIGASGATVLSDGGGVSQITLQDRPEIRVDGTRLISTGGITAKHAYMWAVDGGANFENFYVGGEYADFNVRRSGTTTLLADNPNFSGWYVEGSWVLTGEPKSYTVSATNNEVGGFGAPKVGNPFSFSGDSWGAWELVARYSDTDLNWHDVFAGSATQQAGINGGEERIVDLGVNWYLNNNVKLQLHDLITNVDKYSGTTHDLAHRASQDFNTIGLRLQFTN